MDNLSQNSNGFYSNAEVVEDPGTTTTTTTT